MSNRLWRGKMNIAGEGGGGGNNEEHVWRALGTYGEPTTHLASPRHPAVDPEARK